MSTTAATPSGSAGLVLAGMTLANAMILVDQTAVPLTLPAGPSWVRSKPAPAVRPP